MQTQLYIVWSLDLNDQKTLNNINIVKMKGNIYIYVA